MEESRSTHRWLSGLAAPAQVARGASGSVLAAGHFQQVITELSLHRTLHLVQWGAEHDGVEFLDHLARTERTQVTALAARGAGGIVLGNLSEIGAAFDGSFQLVALFFSRAMGSYSVVRSR